MPEVTVSSKGQIVLPRNLREALGLHEGDRVDVILEDDTILIRRLESPAKHDWRRWRGCLKGTKALQEHIAEHAEEAEYERMP